jgi:exosortase/archaeosortase family protein
MGHLFLSSWRRKFVLSLWVLPITIVKNAIRIVTLTLLGVYVDPRILESTLHSRGGIPFFVMALSLLGVVLWFWGGRRIEALKEQSQKEKQGF